MRPHAAPLLVASLLPLACTDDADPLAGASQAATTAPGTTDEPASAATTGASETTEATGSTSDAPTSDTPTSDAPTSDAPTSTGDPADPFEAARQLCVDTINTYRATLGLPPYARWTAAEACTDAQAHSDGETDTPHGAFGTCGELAQNECPGWPGPPADSLPGCLEQMWAEGPGEDFGQHGHYLNMASAQYTAVACGFAEVGGAFWMIQNFR